MGRDRTLATWAVGAGLEYGLSQNWSIKGEYMYLATGESYTTTGTVVGGAIAGAVISSTHTDPNVHTAKFGINYRFGGQPVVAKY